MLKIGQADAIIMNTENHTVVIDCGENDDGDEVVKFLTKRAISGIDTLIITHFDKDHIGGVPEVLDSITAEKIIIPDYSGTNNEYSDFLNCINAQGYSPVVLTEKTTLMLDDVLFEIYPAQKNAYKESDNDFSIAVSVKHGTNKFLFTGGSEAERLSEILTQTCGEFDFLKVPHHGKYNRMTETFIKNISPRYTVTTCSDKNPADPSVITLLGKLSYENYFTSGGDIQVTSDGTNITVAQ